MSQTKKDDLYQKWTLSGKLKENLLIISMLVKANVPESEIADYFEVTLTDYRLLRRNHPDFEKANDPKDAALLVKCFKTLDMLAHGYYKTNKRRHVYQSKKGADKASLEESETWYPPSMTALVYMLEKFGGPEWSVNAETLKIQEKKLEQMKEEWK